MSPVEQRKSFIREWEQEVYSVAELCRRFGVSRKTGYKWIDRYMGGCELEDRSRRPRSCAHAIPTWLEDAIVQGRKQRPRWGPRKLRDYLARSNPEVVLPSVSTFAAIFKRNGLIVRRRRRRRTPPASAPLAHAKTPNEVWCIDFKGDFALGRGRCYPLTITDAFSRYLVASVALRSTRADGVRRAMEDLFAQFGLPERIRTDNGCPFASNAPQGFSELSVWWMKLGIAHERIEPGKPQQNGRHERMHATMQQHIDDHPCATLPQQQRSFDRFRVDFNERRPHQALGGSVPADFYERSARSLPIPHWGRDFEYSDFFETARVSKSGTLAWGDRVVHISSVFAHQLLGLSWDQLGWEIFFGPRKLGRLTRSGSREKFHFKEECHPCP
jgi:transposase InsO family protein